MRKPLSFDTAEDLWLSKRVRRVGESIRAARPSMTGTVETFLPGARAQPANRSNGAVRRRRNRYSRCNNRACLCYSIAHRLHRPRRLQPCPVLRHPLRAAPPTSARQAPLRLQARHRAGAPCRPPRRQGAPSPWREARPAAAHRALAPQRLRRAIQAPACRRVRKRMRNGR